VHAPLHLRTQWRYLSDFIIITTVSAVGQKGRNVRWPRRGTAKYIIMTALTLDKRMGRQTDRRQTVALRPYSYGLGDRTGGHSALDVAGIVAVYRMVECRVLVAAAWWTDDESALTTELTHKRLDNAYLDVYD